MIKEEKAVIKAAKDWLYGIGTGIEKHVETLLCNAVQALNRAETKRKKASKAK